MRFHTLRLTAVGPFPGTEIIDFDALGADGLFLLHGRTGAGKTTVLDAITFALYGEVPGHRRTAGMKSTHAPADREPWVELEFTLGQVRWNIRRRAAFDRPKKRGTGTVRENAKLLLSRREGEDLVPVSDNIQGAAAEIRQLMPLSMAQFTKVILLPQGEFAEFLHASSLEKQEVLQKLFDTRIYQDLQWRLAEDAKDYRRRDEELGTRITEQTSMLRAAAQELLASTEPPSPEGEETGDEEPPAATFDAELQEHSGVDLLDVVDKRAAERAEQVIAVEEQAAVRKREAEVHAAERAEQHRCLTAWEQYRQHSAAHEGAREQVEQDRTAVQAHAEAEELSRWFDEVIRLARLRDQRREASTRAEEEAQARLRAQQDITWESAADEGQGFDEALTALVELRGRLGAQRAQELEAQQSTLQREEGQLVTQCEAMNNQVQEVTSAAQALRDEVSSLEVEPLEDGPFEADQARLRRRIEHLVRRAELIERRDEQLLELERAEAAAREQTATVQAAEQEHRRRLRVHLAGVASRLAADLEDGERCAVCGSRDHPEPASPEAEEITAEQVEEASDLRRSAQEESARRHAAEQAVRSRLTELEAALEAADDGTSAEPGPRVAAEGEVPGLQEAEASGDIDVVKDGLAAARVHDEQITAHRHQLRDRRERLTQARTELYERERRTLELTHRTASLERERQDTRTRIESIAETLTELRGSHPTVTDRLRALESLRETLTQAQHARRAAEDAESRRLDAERTAAERLAESRFSDHQQAEAARLDPEELARRTDRVQAYDRQTQRLQDRAQSPEVLTGERLTAEGTPDPGAAAVTEAQEAAEARRQDHEAARMDRHAFDRLRTAVQRTASQLRSSLTAQQQLAEDQRLRAELAATLNGTGPENTRSMTLTSYVLAARLERVAEAATRHLQTMSDGRYRLSHDDTESGRGRLGLELKVHDEHSDVERPTSSLSGGETFMASLAMALGLAEVVQSEAGGIGLDSLFIDEGFGSLDEETLEHVMSALHRLQGEGRRVGVVSHVTEMHRAIPTQLRIDSGPGGSTTRAVLPVSG
ncbi:SMC family ATPase [Nesterenkonia aerolata]|uniref:Nuclease SbcCD subunit C n=1 Tax=Nesterenkonia aerolata TaxID=3074079 RepID=A0ABU2DTC6_9MICC|nr:SMC family ATPase [Nesterenkonia sp. LY-0111]MDR8019540.1 SMC family ATPase [Nesterenkonia sp. LY-0111]